MNEQSASSANAPVFTRTKIQGMQKADIQDFTDAYAQLNEQQKQAVDTTDGPLMVVAGPGTGKTQVVALRVASILQKTHMRPSNILCLTFSKSGATAMRKRLRTYIGADAYGVTVDTIHGFCNSVISQNPQVFEDWNALEQISDIERYREMNAIIDSHMPKLALVSKKSPHSRTRNILSRISQLKREGVVEPEVLSSIADEYEQVLSQKSREGTKAHQRNLLTAKKFKEFLTLFHDYQAMLKETGRYDYDDMILHTVEALREEEWLLSSIQERYQYVLVDEFQDTNGSQYALIDLLTTDPTGDNAPNLFVVGDDDQAIYRFQGANLSNILSFREKYPQAPVVALTQSYRCTQQILDAADNLISNNTERLVHRIEGLDKKLVSATQKTGIEPTLYIPASNTSEPWLIADCIEQRLKEGIHPNDVAVLVQTNAELLPLYEVFEARNIPVQLSGKIDLLSHPLVSQLVCLLQAIDAPSDNVKLGNALGCACFGCHAADLSRLQVLMRSESKSLREIVLLLDDPKADLPTFQNTQAIIAARDTLLSLQAQLSSRTILSTLERCIKDSGILPLLQVGATDIVDMAAVQEFFDRIKQRAYEQPTYALKHLLADLEYYQNDEYGDIRMTYDLPHLTQDGVQLMTAHRSKGLEFHTVIIANYREGHWDHRRNPPSLSVPEDLLFGWETDQKKYEKEQDERRVAFVAMTRAKKELLFTCPKELSAGDSLKAVSPSAFFAESGNLPEEAKDCANPEQMSTFLSVQQRSFDAELTSFLQSRLEYFALSATALNDFLQDPQLFLDRHLLLLPQARSLDFSFGNAVHHILARWGLSVLSGNPIQYADVEQGFLRHLEDREILTNAERENISELGKTVLTQYYNTHMNAPYPLIHKVEYDVRAHLGDIPLKGKIDRIDLLEPGSNQIALIDYKTGAPKSEKQIEEYGYKRQLLFYSLLVEESTLALTPRDFVLEFVGTETQLPAKSIFTFTEDEKKELKQLIEDVWAKIQALDFTPL